MQFPQVAGSNLQRKKLNLPEAIEGETNLVFVAFQQWHQSQVDSWIPYAKQIEETYQNVRYYELPTLQQLNVVSRTYINEGMRAGIADPVARERTITLYVDKTEFRKALQLASEDNIYVLLLNRQGEVLWRNEGSLTPAKGEVLADRVRGWLHDEAE